MSSGAGTERFDEVARQQYVQFTTFRKTGVPVSSPVWIARATEGDPDTLVFTSMADAGKVKRLNHTKRVELRPCDMRGRVPEGAPTWTGSARVVRDADGLYQVKRSLGAKYGRWYSAFALAERLVLDRIPGRGKRVGIRITLD